MPKESSQRENDTREIWKARNEGRITEMVDVGLTKRWFFTSKFFQICMPVKCKNCCFQKPLSSLDSQRNTFGKYNLNGRNKAL